MYDPLKLARSVAEVVCKDTLRKYYRFRGGLFYGGSAAADVVGCNLRCAFCWSAGSRRLDIGEFYSPQEVANKLLKIANSRGYELVRVTGGEPTLCREHLIELIEGVTKRGKIFILETNGILLGSDPGYAKEIASAENVYVRVSIKAPNEKWFERVTGARGEAFELQLKALENLVRYGKEPPWLRAAVVLGYGSDEEYAELLRRLYSIHPGLSDVEWEVLTLYPHIKRRLERLGLLPRVFREEP